MFCSKCGSEMSETARFCPACGAPNEDLAAPVAEDVTAAPEPAAEAPLFTEEPVAEAAQAYADTDAYTGAYTAPARKGMGKGAVLGVVAAVLALVVLAAVLLLSLGGGAKTKLGKAAVKSLKAYESAADSVGVPDLKKLSESKKLTQSGSIELRSIAGMDSDLLKGLGVRFTSGCDLKGRKLDFSGTAFFGSTDLIGAEASVDDSVVSVYVPEFFDGTAYGLDTTTLGKDLDKLSDGEVPEEYTKLSFNLFDLLETLDVDPPQIDKSANKAFVKAIEVKKTGTSSIEVNGKSLKCTQYHVLIPKDAMKDYLDAVKDAYKAMDYDKKLIEALRSLGLPKEELADIEDEIKYGYDEGFEGFDELKDFIKELGDVEFEVYVNGGYVNAVVWEGKLYGSRSELNLYLGGGKNYVDDLSMELRADETRVTLSSNGDHAAKDGSFTDTTTLRYRDSWSDETVKSELEYAPNKSSDNLSWHLKADDMTLKAEGTLAMNKESFDMQLDDLSLSDGGGEKQFAVRAGWSVGPYSAQKLSSSKTTLLSSMSRDDLEDLVEDVSDNAQRWAERMYEKNGDLFNMLSWYF